MIRLEPRRSWGHHFLSFWSPATVRDRSSGQISLSFSQPEQMEMEEFLSFFLFLIGIPLTNMHELEKETKKARAALPGNGLLLVIAVALIS